MAKSGAGSGTVTSDPAGIDCGLDCTEAYPFGSEIGLGQTPDIGSVFGGWSGDADCADGRVTINADVNCTAKYDLQSFTLTVAKSGAGRGTVTSDPTGIDCGIDCSEIYPSGQVVDLGQVADVGSSFAGWSGDADCADGRVTINADVSCTATYDPATFALTVVKSGSGTGTVISDPSGIDCGIDCSETYPFGQVVDLGQAADVGFVFGGWSGDADCSDGQVTMNTNVSCTATFFLPNLTVTATSAEGRPQAGGTVTSNPAGITCGDAGADCSQTYVSGTVVTLTAAPSASRSFTGWSGDCSGLNTVVQVVMSGNNSCGAAFSSTIS